MLNKTLQAIFGSKNSRELKRMGKIVKQINQLEPEFEALDETALKAKTAEFKARLSQGESLDKLLAEAFAAVREASNARRPYCRDENR